MGCYILIQGIFPNKGLNPGLQHCRQILYQLNHQGSPYLCLQAPIIFYIFEKKKKKGKIQENKHNIITLFSFYAKQIIERDERDE